MMRKNSWLTPILFVLIALLLINPVVYIIYKNMLPKIVTVDLQLLVEENQKHILSGLGEAGKPVTEQQRLLVETYTIDFAKNLSTAISSLENDCRCVIVNKAAVLGGAVDYTPLIRERMKP